MSGHKINKPTALGMLVPARFTRERTEEFAPMLAYAPRKGTPVISVLAGEDALPAMVSGALAKMRRELGPAEWIAVTSDAYVKALPVGEAPPEGRLETAFSEGDPTVMEQMVVVLVDRYAGVDVASQTYRYIPSEGWEWDEPVQVTEYSSELIRSIKHYM